MTAKAAGQPKSPFLQPPRQRPTLQRRNVVAHLPEEYRDEVDRKMATAYAMRSTADAKRALEKLHRELQELNPSAARSLAEGMDETLTVHRLPVEGWLRRMLATTNPIESTFSVVDTVCRRVKCWQRGDHVERWVGSALWVSPTFVIRTLSRLLVAVLGR